MARQDRQAVLPDGYRTVRSLGSVRKIRPRALWAMRVFGVLIFGFLLASGDWGVASAAEMAGSVVGFVAVSYLIYAALVRLASEQATEVPATDALAQTDALPTVGAAERRQLKSAGYETVAALALADTDELVDQTPFARERVERMQSAARERFESRDAARARLRGGSSQR